MLGSKPYELVVKRLEEKIERNLAMAEQYSFHPVFSEKFLNQAIEAEAELEALNAIP